MSETTTKRATGRTTAKRAVPQIPSETPNDAPRPARAKAAASRRPMPTSHAIAERAYARYVERGYVDGHDLEDWYVAERELADAPAPRRPRKATAAGAR
jgi:hypothetical protein